MKPLESLDRRHLNAAIAWLELGSKNHREAKEELWQMNSCCRTHPRFLHIWWHICTRAGDWDTCLEIAKQRIHVRPDDGDNWSDLSHTLHRMNRTKEALDSLLAVADKFPQSDLIPHNLACYLCVLGRVDEARNWLWQALKAATRKGQGRKRFQSALDDPELKPLQPDLRSLSATKLLLPSDVGNVN